MMMAMPNSIPKFENLDQENKHLREELTQLKEDKAKVIEKERWISIGRLAAGIAHEINNPLGFVQNNLFALDLYIQNFSQLIQNYHLLLESIAHIPEVKAALTKLKEIEKSLKIAENMVEINNAFTQCHDGLKRIENIVKTIRNFSQNESVSEEETEPYNINICVENAIILTKTEHRYHTDFITDSGDIPLIECNPGKLTQVFLNILINACHAIREFHSPDQQRGMIMIKTKAVRNQIICEITDNGPGIPEEIQNHIFDPFFTTKGAIGTGLGLSICTDIISKHKGEITLTSKLNQGTSFIITLPQ